MNIEDYLKKSVEKLRSYPKSTRIRIISHYDTDGICSAAILAKSIEREGFDFHVSLLNHPFREELEKLGKEENDLIIFSDLGSGQIDLIKNLNVDSIILDHHQPEYRDLIIDSIIQINSNLFGIDGNFEVSGAGLCYLFARVLNKENVDLSVFSLLGAIGDKQNLGGFKGINKEIFEEARKNNLIKVSKASLKIGNGELVDEITNSVDPFYPRLSGRIEEVENRDDRVYIAKESRFGDFNNEERKSLLTSLMVSLLKNRIEPEVADEVIKERIVSDKLPMNLDIISEMIDSCSKSGDPGLALSFCLNPEKFFEIVKNKSEEYKRKILEKLVRLEDGDLEERKNMVYFLSERASEGSYMSGIVSNYFDCKAKPVFSFTKKNGKIHVSCRARRRAVEQGLDLGYLMREVANKFGGAGGGHKIAAGGTFENTSLEELIEFIDSMLGKNES